MRKYNVLFAVALTTTLVGLAAPVVFAQDVKKHVAVNQVDKRINSPSHLENENPVDIQGDSKEIERVAKNGEPGKIDKPNPFPASIPSNNRVIPNDNHNKPDESIEKEKQGATKNFPKEIGEGKEQISEGIASSNLNKPTDKISEERNDENIDHPKDSHRF